MEEYKPLVRTLALTWWMENYAPRWFRILFAAITIPLGTIFVGIIAATLFFGWSWPESTTPAPESNPCTLLVMDGFYDSPNNWDRVRAQRAQGAALPANQEACGQQRGYW